MNWRMRTVKEKNDFYEKKLCENKMQYAPIFLVFLIITFLAYWVTMKSIIVPPKKRKKETTTSNFIPKQKFTGHKHGYVFKKGNLGLGYYKDY